MNRLLKNMELHLTFVGLLAILASGVVSQNLDTDTWKVTAITATTVGIIHGIIFWLVRRRQRRVRHAAIESVKAMLKDVVNNQLAIIRLANDLNANKPGTIDPTKIDNSIEAIKSAVESLSNESLQLWQERYDRS